MSAKIEVKVYLVSSTLETSSTWKDESTLIALIEDLFRNFWDGVIGILCTFSKWYFKEVVGPWHGYSFPQWQHMTIFGFLKFVLKCLQTGDDLCLSQIQISSAGVGSPKSVKEVIILLKILLLYEKYWKLTLRLVNEFYMFHKISQVSRIFNRMKPYKFIRDPRIFIDLV